MRPEIRRPAFAGASAVVLLAIFVPVHSRAQAQAEAGHGAEAGAQGALNYQRPPAGIEALLDAPLTPVVRVAPNRGMLLVEQPQSYPTIVDVAQPRLRLAGLRFNPATNGPSREVATVGLWLQAAAGGDPRPIAGLPPTLRASRALWSPDSSALLRKTVPSRRGAAPHVSEVPAGPNVEENLDKLTPARTYEDLLRTPADEAIFEYYAASELAVVRLRGPALRLPVSGLLTVAQPSPDGCFALTETLHRPFSYALPAENFPARVAIVALPSGAATLLSDHPLLDAIPIAFDAVPTGPRDHAWRSDAPATVVWVEAADGDDPKVAAALA